ncbi:hypothetical protein LCGC14_1508310 [marine sediment metagenome]|uniref:DUF2213 domain-containing protein n=1 Tax=marine sediment metagenome TaxID=412755 RepID=A0A0F9JMU0_9ZZZZ
MGLIYKDDMKRKSKSVLGIHSILVDNYEVRTELRNGSEHLVVPVIMMVEGVHHGSQGPILYTTEELSIYPSAWNGSPITIEHPNNVDGMAISANDPTVEAVGRVYNVHMEGDKLRGDAWVDMALVKARSDAVLEHLLEQRPLDVSIGAFSDNDGTEGDFNGEHYDAIARNIRPDHLALLPGGVGACSWDDGCGIRNNELNKLKTKREGGPTVEEKEKKEKVNPRLEQLFVNETGFREIGMNIQRQLDAMDNNVKMHFLEEIFDNTYIFRVSNHSDNTSTYFRQSYSVNDSGEVELGDNATEVRKQVTFETLEQNSSKMTRTKYSKKKEIMDVVKNVSSCKVDALIVNEANKWAPEDKEWLLTLSEGQFEKMVPEVEKVEKVIVENNIITVPTTEKKETPEVTEDQLKAILNKSDDPVAFIDKFIPATLGAQMKQGLKMYTDKREKLITEIVENSKFTKERLESFETEDLENLHESTVPEVSDYSVFGNQARTVEKKVSKDMEMMLNLGTKEDSKK